MKSAVFFERDGILNLCETVNGREHVPRRVEEFRPNTAAAPLLASLRDAGCLLLVATNQPGVSQGLIPRNELDLMHTVLRRALPVDDILVCPYDDASHPCRKPNPGLFIEAAFKWGLDLDHSFVVSNKWEDAKAAQIAGCTSVLCRSPWVGNDHHDFLVDDLEAAIRKILHCHHRIPFVAAIA